MTDSDGTKGAPDTPEPSAEVNARKKRRWPSEHLIQPFLIAYERCENQSQAGAEVGVSHDTVSRWKRNPAFMKLFTAAHIRAQRKHNDDLRGSAIQRAIKGSPRVLTYQGKVIKDDKGNPVITHYELETQLTMFMLKNRLPDEFRDKFEHEISGQLIVTLATEFLSIVRRHATPEISTAIQRELETLSAKMTAQ